MLTLNSVELIFRQHLKKFNSLVVFSHNDLQEGNILITNDSINSDQPNLVLIDYEYCSYNYRGFELANHFLEYTMNYKAKEYPYFKVDSSTYPSIEHQVNCIVDLGVISPAQNLRKKV